MGNFGDGAGLNGLPTHKPLEVLSTRSLRTRGPLSSSLDHNQLYSKVIYAPSGLSKVQDNHPKSLSSPSTRPSRKWKSRAWVVGIKPILDLLKLSLLVRQNAIEEMVEKP